MPSRTCRGARRGAALGCAAAVMAALTACTATEAGTVEDDPAQVTPAPGYLDANVQGPRLQDDIGHPGVGVADWMAGRFDGPGAPPPPPDTHHV